MPGCMAALASVTDRRGGWQPVLASMVDRVVRTVCGENARGAGGMMTAQEPGMDLPHPWVAVGWETMESILRADTREERERLLWQNCPRPWLERYRTYRERARLSVAAGVCLHDFVVLPSSVPVPMDRWLERNFSHRGVGETLESLVIVGPPCCGKSVWAERFGKPAVMYGRWDADVVRVPGTTHLVLNDMDVARLSGEQKQELAACRVRARPRKGGDDAEPAFVHMPVVWTCNDFNSVLKDEELARSLRQHHAIVVHVHGKLYASAR